MTDVRINEHAAYDPRFVRLAELLGLSDADHAIGRMFHVWLAALKRGTHSLPAWVINSAFGHKGAADALLACELAERVTSAMVSKRTCEQLVVGELRLKGTADTAHKVLGGKIRAKTARRVVSPNSNGPVFAPAAVGKQVGSR